jgi:hypothetical protein
MGEIEKKGTEVPGSVAVFEELSLQVALDQAEPMYTNEEMKFLDTTDASYALWTRKTDPVVRMRLARFIVESGGADVFQDARAKIDLLNAALLAGIIPPSVAKESVAMIKASMDLGAPSPANTGIFVGGGNVQFNVQAAIDTYESVRRAASTPGETIAFVDAGRYTGKKDR